MVTQKLHRVEELITIFAFSNRSHEPMTPIALDGNLTHRKIILPVSINVNMFSPGNEEDSPLYSYL